MRAFRQSSFDARERWKLRRTPRLLHTRLTGQTKSY